MLELINVSYRYRSQWLGAPSHGIDRISLSVGQGEAFGFLGRNGAGKTTTIKCILDLVRPISGTISLCGASNRRAENRSRVGYVPEQPYFYDHLTVLEALTMFAELAGLVGTRRNEAVRAVVEQLGLSGREHTKLKALSKGLTQRVAIGQAIIASPSLLILDEPFSGLDPVGRREIRELLLSLKRNGTTIFMSSHVLSDVEKICDRAAIMSSGKLKGVFDLHNLPSLNSTTYELELRGSVASTGYISPSPSSVSEQTDSCVFGFSSRELAESALRVALNNNIEVLSYGIQRGSLEDLFTELSATESAAT